MGFLLNRGFRAEAVGAGIGVDRWGASVLGRINRFRAVRATVLAADHLSEEL
jgi:hypothetical protein